LPTETNKKSSVNSPVQVGTKAYNLGILKTEIPIGELMLSDVDVQTPLKSVKREK
jgi:hypothetical protein